MDAALQMQQALQEAVHAAMAAGQEMFNPYLVLTVNRGTAIADTMEQVCRKLFLQLRLTSCFNVCQLSVIRCKCVLTWISRNHSKYAGSIPCHMGDIRVIFASTLEIHTHTLVMHTIRRF